MLFLKYSAKASASELDYVTHFFQCYLLLFLSCSGSQFTTLDFHLFLLSALTDHLIRIKQYKPFVPRTETNLGKCYHGRVSFQIQPQSMSTRLCLCALLHGKVNWLGLGSWEGWEEFSFVPWQWYGRGKWEVGVVRLIENIKEELSVFFLLIL